MLLGKMRFTTVLSTLLAVSTAVAASPVPGHDVGDDSSIEIFGYADRRWDGAICKGILTKHKFPNLVAPTNEGGCVRYFQGVDMTGVATTVNIYFPKIKTACDCAGLCLASPTTCTNWVFKYTFAGKNTDHGKRSCTLYSNTNLPTGVTLGYNLATSSGFQVLGNNPQAGGPAPLTFLDAANTKPDPFGVSGFITQDQNNKQYC